jgi:GNAT superfamily N-acetyltransferase
MPDYRIREVDGRDPEIASDLREVHERSFGDTAPLVSTHVGHWWLVYHDDAPVAFAGLVKACQHENSGYFIRAGVLPEHRGNGLQRRLIRVREMRARKNGWTRIVTETNENIPSANSLIGAGFKLYAPRNPWGLSTALYWTKDL